MPTGYTSIIEDNPDCTFADVEGAADGAELREELQDRALRDAGHAACRADAVALDEAGDHLLAAGGDPPNACTRSPSGARSKRASRRLPMDGARRVFTLRLNDEDWAASETAAEREGEPVTQWAREALLSAALGR